MVSACGRYVFSYNGEIYNGRSTRTKLEQEGTLTFRGHSDTELLVEAINAWRLAPAVAATAGMFAFACWNRERRELSCATALASSRSFGESIAGSWPLRPNCAAYANSTNGPTISTNSLLPTTRGMDGSAPRKQFCGTYGRLNPAALLRSAPTACGCSDIGLCWIISTIRAQSTTDDALEQLLAAVTKEHLISDVTFGAFLSGVIDSSLVAAMACMGSVEPITTFTVGFDDPRFDEASYARSIADRLHTRHVEVKITAAEAIQTVPHVASWYDEPFADASQLPTGLIASGARTEVTVALSGDGGDELFAGYERGFWISRL